MTATKVEITDSTGNPNPGDADVGLGFGDASVDGAAQLAVGQLGEPALHQVDPTRAGRRELQVETWDSAGAICGSPGSCGLRLNFQVSTRWGFTQTPARSG